jgi:CheY-like chemotaxis protein
VNETLHSKRWLVVDDDPAVLALTTSVLRSLPGSVVVACDDPRQALATFLADPESFEMLVTDFDMPSLDGLELSRRIRVESPRLPVLLISGSDLETADVIRAGLDAFLSKPCRPDQLLEVVRSLRMQHKDPSAVSIELAAGLAGPGGLPGQEGRN